MRTAIVFFVLGVAVLQQQAALQNFFYLSMLALACLVAILSARYLIKLPALRFPLVVAAAAGAGFVWASLYAHAYLRDSLAPEWEGRDVSVVGIVDSLPYQFGQGVRFNFSVENTVPDGDRAVPALPPRLALSWYANAQQRGALPELRPGERWQLRLRLKRPHGNANPDGFDYEVWLLEQNLRATGTVRGDSAQPENRRLDAFVWSAGNAVERCRALLRQRIHDALPAAPYAGVLVALVVGDQREIAQSDWKVFNRAGIGHLISISGLHITMVAGLFSRLVFFLWRRSFFIGSRLPLYLPAQKAAAVAGALTALLYVALAGFGVPAQRTLTMVSVVALALWLGRLTSLSHVLCLALGAVVLLDPWAVLWPGFWLSFGAVAVIVFAASGKLELPAPATWRQRCLRLWRDASHTQYVVTMGLVPLTILLFGQLSLISPLANAVAIPLISFVVTPLALLGSVLPAPWSGWLLQLAHGCVALLAQLLEYLSGWPLASWSTPLPALSLFAVALAGVLWLLAPRGWPLRSLGLLCCLPLFAQTRSQVPQGELRVIALDVGQGMALLLETAQHRLLYDSGPGYSPESDAGSRVILPYLSARGIKRLDAMLISHNDSDHSGGALSILRQLPVASLITSLAPDSAIVQTGSARHRRCQAGQAWDWDGVRFEILQPVAASYDSRKWKPNARSCVLRVSDGKHTLLLPGDIEAVQEDELLHSIPEKLRADVLLAPHHGSGTSSTSAFLQAVQPELALFQVGYLNRYHHPRPDVYARYADFGVKRLRTDQAGAITLQFGTSLRFSEYRLEHARYWYGR
ncbi:MAG: DNA internalization-related competence protein ComEC/Rec2 [Burkholderiales bacterium]|nr:DNA internalization-related competence protein ComEC/Rec2 [Burkholderiales bacterium]